MHGNNTKTAILIIDDIPENIDVLDGILRDNYKIQAALSGEKALKICFTDNPPDLILLDIMMPGMDGYEVCRQLKANTATKNIPVIFVTAKDETVDEAQGFEAGCVDYITKPVSAPLVKARVRSQLALYHINRTLEQKVQERTKELVHTQDVTLLGMSVLAEYRDNETGGHIMRIQHYVRAMAEKLVLMPKYSGILNKKTITLLFKSAPLHDIGKIGVPDAILLKPGPLTYEEFEIMKQHTLYGGDAIARAEKALQSNIFSSFLQISKDFAYSHHEKYDGSGYPYGLKGEKIPFPGRLLAILDVYDALISRRVYKPPYPHSKAVEIITRGTDRVRPEHFDPDILTVFKDNHDQFRKIAIQFADHDEERRILSR